MVMILDVPSDYVHDCNLGITIRKNMGLHMPLTFSMLQLEGIGSAH
jgi:hypothetical protein